jgi:hypothetical protein
VGRCSGIAGQPQQRRDVRCVLRAQFARVGVGAQIVVAFGQTEPALIEFADHRGGVADVDRRGECEAGIDAERVQAREHCGNIARGRNVIDRRELRL